VPKLKSATLHAKIDALSTELSELQCQHQQLIDSASDSPLIGQYIATRKSGGTAFSRKSAKQAAHDYYALVNTAGTFICYISKHDVSEYRDRIRLGKQVAQLNRAISRCTQRINEYQSKLPPVEQTNSSTAAVPDSLPKSQDNPGDKSGVSGPENKLSTVESATCPASTAA
jgi:hypothetical protein